jgi:hypothetical protein
MALAGEQRALPASVYTAQHNMAGPTAAQPSGGVRAYMALYNILQLLGWSYIMFCTITVARAGGGPPGVWQVGGGRC